MKILILRSTGGSGGRDPFSVRMDTAYASRVIGHLTDTGGYCSSCADSCVACRGKYDLDFSGHIAGILDFPALLPVIVEDPEEYLPNDVPPHDILLPIATNEEILIAFVERFPVSRGIVVPQEGSEWVSPNAIKRITEICGGKGIEVAFPKPFCAFRPDGGVLAEFRREFRIGKPEVQFAVENGVIADTEVTVSAPCGATYFSCRGLEGKNVGDNLTFIIDKQLSCFPCTADHAVDREFGDSITHQATKIQRDILLGIEKDRE